MPVVEVMVELVQLGHLVEDDLKVLLGNDGTGRGQGHLHRLHVLQAHAEALQVDGLRL